MVVGVVAGVDRSRTHVWNFTYHLRRLLLERLTMPTIEQYEATADFIRLLLQGPPGSTKTTTACRFPGAWIFDCDLNLGGPLRWLKEKGLPLPIGYDTIDRKDDGTVVPENMRWQRLCDCINAVAKKAEELKIQTLVIDSATKAEFYNQAHVLRTNPTKSGGLEMPSWGFVRNNWIQLVGTLTSAKVNFVLVCHEKVDKDELDGSLKYFLNIQGSFKDIAGSLFTDVWRAEMVSSGGLNPTYKAVLRTMPDYRFALKNSFGLPPIFEFDWKLIEAKLKGTPS
jgi:DNA polymerase III delta prime subunit